MKKMKRATAIKCRLFQTYSFSSFKAFGYSNNFPHENHLEPENCMVKILSTNNIYQNPNPQDLSSCQISVYKELILI